MDWTDWLSLPETQACLKLLEERFPPDRWRQATDWDQVNKCKGHQEVLEAIRSLDDAG